jgi:hypothetical protein
MACAIANAELDHKGPELPAMQMARAALLAVRDSGYEIFAAAEPAAKGRSVETVEDRISVVQTLVAASVNAIFNEGKRQ